jgi:4-amino-4-deoxy-L-arabinose transferase-like glycosyltransferase
MKRLNNREMDAVRNCLFLLFVLIVLAACRSEIRLLWAPDPPVAWTYHCSFDADRLLNDARIIGREGFMPDRQGLQLLPAAAGRLVLAFEKEPHQGCLLRVWFYGDRGGDRPNAITIIPEGGIPVRLAENENHVGAVFDISDRLRGVGRFRISFEAENRAPFPARVLDAVEVVAGLREQVKPSLPDLPKLLGLLFAAYVIIVLLFSQTMRNNQKLCRVLILLILLLAVYLRWNEVLRVSGTMLDEDARGYYGYAQKIQPAGDHGFYSAHFEKREPLFIFLVKLFFAMFGASPTHLRFVSFAFSLVAIYLTYRIGREWFHEAAGLTAAFILSVHPYLIQLSARGLREEWFTALLLLFLYIGCVRSSIRRWASAVVSGIIAGCIVLTRSESFPMIAIILLLYPLLTGRKWNYAMAALALVLSLSLWIPHQYSIYKKYGDFFYTANQYARFYANREFAGTPGFPTKQEIGEKGMYYGPKITPLAYYWNLHSPRQLLSGSLAGFIKINLRMPFSFISGRGNAETVIYAVRRVMQNHGMKEVLNVIRLAGRLVRDNLLANVMGLVILLSFLAGLVLMGRHHHWKIFFYLIIFQLHTSFLASLGLDQRLTIHSYPLIALCCGYCVQRLFHRGRAAAFAPRTIGKRRPGSSADRHNALLSMVAG